MYGTDASGALPPREAWEIARSQLRLQMTKSTYDTWVRDTVCLAHEDGCLCHRRRQTPMPGTGCRCGLRPLIKRTLTSIVGRAVDVTFVVQPDSGCRSARSGAGAAAGA